MKRISKILLSILVILLVTVFCLYDTFLVEPRKYHIRNESLSSEAIPLSLDDISILFFSDLDYGTFMDETRLCKLVSKINASGADVVIFGGDLYDTGVTVDDTMQTTVSSWMTQIQAPLGKFAVYGDFDTENEMKKQYVTNTLLQSGFEPLENKSVNIRNKSSESITLIGLNDGLNSTQDITAAYSTVSHSNYSITICHTPDTADFVPTDITNYFLAGHSKGGQIYWLFDSYYSPQMAVKHFRGKDTIASAFTLDITNGVGTTGTDARLFANAEVVLYRLHSSRKPVREPEVPSEQVQTPEETAVPEETQIIVPEETQTADPESPETTEENTNEDVTSEEIPQEEDQTEADSQE